MNCQHMTTAGLCCAALTCVRASVPQLSCLTTHREFSYLVCGTLHHTTKKKGFLNLECTSYK